MVQAYPLDWPSSYPGTEPQDRKDSRFKTTLGAARDFVKEEIRRLGGDAPVISTNIPLKDNGDLRADWARFKVEDPGVAVYFMRNGIQVCLCCDTYNKVHENLHAVGRTIAALRQIDRDGVSDFLNRAFTGFKALPEKATIDNVWTILDMEPTNDPVVVNRRYKELCKRYAQDEDRLRDLNMAREEAIKKIKQ